MNFGSSNVCSFHIPLHFASFVSPDAGKRYETTNNVSSPQGYVSVIHNNTMESLHLHNLFEIIPFNVYKP